MKIPKKIRMLGYDWKVILNKKESGGSFDWNTKIIEVGSKYGEHEPIFLHEIMEALMTDMYMRYRGTESNQEYVFHFNHTDFCKFHKALYQVLSDNKLI